MRRKYPRGVMTRLPWGSATRVRGSATGRRTQIAALVRSILSPYELYFWLIVTRTGGRRAMDQGESERKMALRAELDEAREEFAAAVQALRAEDLARPVGHASDWTVKDLVGHVAYAEASMLPLIEAALRGVTRQLPADFDLARWNEGRVRRAREQTLSELLERPVTSRATALALLDSLSDADLDRPASHPVALATTIEGIFRIIARHEREHAAEIRAAIG